MARLPLVRIGLFGLGTDWQERLSPALERMQARVRVVAVYDDVALAAQTAAANWHAEPVLGIRALLIRRDVDAILLRSAGWQRDWLVDRLREQHLPTLLGPEVTLNRRQIDAWYRSSESEGTIVIPELRLRYQPTTLRLRELLATALGRVTRLVIHVPPWSRPSAGSVPLADLLDWSTTLIDATPVGIKRASANEPSAAPAVSIIFERLRGAAGGAPVEVVLAWDLTSAGDDSGRSQTPLCEVTCECGTAAVLTSHDVQWTAGGEPQLEKLTSDRSSTEVLLDLFARRVLGGLIPTPDLGDLRRAQELAEAVLRVQCTATPTSLRPTRHPRGAESRV